MKRHFTKTKTHYLCYGRTKACTRTCAFGWRSLFSEHYSVFW